MKKIIYIFSLFIILVNLSSCNLIKQATCKHEYKIHSIHYSTCSVKGKKVEICVKCEHELETILELEPHEFERKELKSTCKQEGKIYDVCKKCKFEKIIEKIDKQPHKITETIFETTCENDGYTLKKCDNCDFEEKTNVIKSEGHDLSEWIITTNPTDTHDGLKQRVCSKCDYIESEYILSTSYIDLSTVKYQFDNSKIIDVNSYSDLLLVFNAGILARSETFQCKINFEFDSLNDLVNKLIKDTTLFFSFKTKTNYSNQILTFTFEHQDEPTLSSTTTYYKQYTSFNYQSINQIRPDDYDNFHINSSLYTYQVETTDQLVYVLERGVKPICKEGSNAEKAYNKLKEILIKIINDNMSDIEKVKAIHDYIIMNITYDNELLLKLYQNVTNLKDYRGFYLEGALFDKLAVCEGISKTFTALCNIEGIPCVTVEGIQTNNPGGAGHAWNKVYVNDNWYIVDATSDGTILNNAFEVLSYKFFLIDEKTHQTSYTGNNFTSIECQNNINIYENTFFTYNNKIYDFNITSQDELNILVAYFEKENIKYSTIEFKINFEYGESCLDEIKSAYQNNNINAQYFYVNQPDNFMLIKIE